MSKNPDELVTTSKNEGYIEKGVQYEISLQNQRKYDSTGKGKGISCYKWIR